MQRVSIWKFELAATVAALLLLFGLTWAFGFFDGMSVNGVVALLLGVVLSTALGVGLMALVFASSRGADAAAHQPAPPAPERPPRNG